MKRTQNLHALRYAVAVMAITLAGAASAQVCCNKPAGSAPAPAAALAPTPAAAPAPAPVAGPAKTPVASKPSAAKPVAAKPAAVAAKPVVVAKPALKVVSSDSLAYIRSMTTILQGGAK